jgi:hypothetical protein
VPTKKSFLLRIDPRLWTELNRWAKDELRSVNGQVEYILRNAVARRKKARGTPGSEAAYEDADSEEFETVG